MVLDVDPAAEVRTATVAGIGGRWAADPADGSAGACSTLGRLTPC